MSGRSIALIVVLIAVIGLLLPPACTAATTELHIVKYANDRSTVLSEKTLTYQEMRDTLPVQGDGSSHYFHQGPVFIDNSDEDVEQQLRWNPDEDTNVLEKDMGAVMGTSVKDLCDLVGGMTDGDTLLIKSSDGMSKSFAYKNVYTPPSRQGPMVITWSCTGNPGCTGQYPDKGYSDGMRLVFFADNSVNPWGEHVFGNYDWHESADPVYWYYYFGEAGEKYPTTTGLSMKYVSEILIYSTKSPPSSSHRTGSGVNLPPTGSAPPEDSTLYGFTGKSMSTLNSGVLNGSLQIISPPMTESVIVKNRIHNINMTVDLPPESNITLARLYVYLSRSYNLQLNKGIVPQFFATFDKQHLEETMVHIDTDGNDNRYLAATYVYDVQGMLRKNGTYELSFRNLNPEEYTFTIEGIILVAGYENKTSPPVSYWIGEGCDVISSNPKKGLFPDNCTTDFSFPGKVNMSRVHYAELHLYTTGIDNSTATEHTVTFNNQTWQNILDNQSPLASLRIPVTDYLNETGNILTIKSAIRSQDADYLINRNAILLIQEQDSDLPVSLPANDGKLPENSGELYPGRATENPVIPNESSYCHLDLDTDPQGALIYLDGSYLGKTTPYHLDVEKGHPYSIRFELDGYNPSESTIIPSESACIRESLYTAVHSTKDRLADIPADLDGIQYGGLYITSRPTGAMILIDGADTGKITPAIINGLKPRSYTVRVIRVLKDKRINDRSDFNFEEQHVSVLPGVLLPVDINGIGQRLLYEVIIDSRTKRGIPFTLNGYISNTTIPMKVSTEMFESFITVRENDTYISYPLPVFLSEDRYWLFPSGNPQNLEITVCSCPQGAEFFIDGYRTGFTTPYTFGNISDGPHRILVAKPGYLPQQKRIDLPRRSVPIPATSVDFTLEEYPSGFLYVNSIPQGYPVSIDGLSTGELTPALFRNMPTGSHTIIVTGSNTSKTFREITLNSLNMVELTANFTEIHEP
jgi:hypothetical protein